jgi:ubiquinone/menaquinone biosynthesis C-methylase UbiE
LSLAPADDSHILEVGAGTGRVSIPLAKSATRVNAQDISAEMLQVLKGRAETLRVEVDTSCGDASQDLPQGTFNLVLCLFNTFFHMESADKKKAFLRLASSRLSPKGRLIIETFSPRPDMFGSSSDTSPLRVQRVGSDFVVLTARTIDRAKQTLNIQEIVMRDGRLDLVPHVIHYCSFETLDDMAEDAGLRLEQRYSDWTGSPWTLDSPNSISVYNQLGG